MWVFITAVIVPYIKKYYIALNIIMFAIFILITLGMIPKSTNLYYFPIGFFGLGNSLLIDKIRLRNSPGLQVLCFILAIIIGWLGLIYSIGSNILLSIIYIIAVLMTFYNIAKRLNLQSIFSQWVLIFGRYLLFSYIFHLFIIVTLAKLFPGQFSFIYNIFIVILVSIGLLISLVILDNLRKRIEFINKGYKLIFA